jgi:hypothetical protein
MDTTPNWIIAVGAGIAVMILFVQAMIIEHRRQNRIDRQIEQHIALVEDVQDSEEGVSIRGKMLNTKERS